MSVGLSGEGSPLFLSQVFQTSSLLGHAHNIDVSHLGLRLLDIGFFIFHTALVLFNVLGWAWPKTRRWNLYTLLATSASWFVMGIWYGLGYCLCTDWHFQIRRQLGYVDDSPTYIHLIVKMLTGANLDANLVQTATAAGFVFALVMSVYTNLRFRKHADASQVGT